MALTIGQLAQVVTGLPGGPGVGQWAAIGSCS
jgi:hypothetical protein